MQAARGRSVLEFGLRRAQGPDGGLSASRAAMVGGCGATSNVEAGRLFGVPIKGTHAHSYVTAFDDEVSAFRNYAVACPEDVVLLVDTYDTLGRGIPAAIEVGLEMKQRGASLGGIRLDSGDFAVLSVAARKMLNEAGFGEARIVLSGELDELTIWQILTQMAQEAEREGVDWPRLQRRLVYGVGTRLITSAGASALGGVYKLVGLHDAAGEWVPAIKVSNTPAKIPVPGRKRAWRLYDRRGFATADVVTRHDAAEPFADGRSLRLHHPYRDDASRTVTAAEVSRVESLHEIVFADGAPTSPAPPIDGLRARCRADVDSLGAGVRRLVNPHTYHVSLDEPTKALQRDLVARARAGAPD